MSRPESHHHDPHHQYRAAAHHPKKLAKLSTKHQEIVAGTALGIFMVIFIGAIWLVGFKSSWHLIHPSSNTPKQAALQKPVTVKAPVTSAEFEITLYRHWSNKGGEVYKAAPGFVYQIVDAGVTQHSGQAKWLAPAIQSYLMDGSGQQYALSPIDTNHAFVSQSYESGQEARGELGYEVPEGAQNLKWCYFVDDKKTDPLCADLQ